MGGTSTSSQTQSQTGSTTSNPYAPATGILNGILGQIQGGLGGTGVTPTENNALNDLWGNATNYSNTYAPQMNNYAQSLLNGGGANAQAGNLTANNAGYQGTLNGLNTDARGNLSTLTSYLTPYANGSMVGNNPALQAQLDQIRTDVTNQVNPAFAAAGRDFSGANAMALGRGVAAGEAPVIANQYNQDVSNQMNAASALYGAGNSTNQLIGNNASAGYGAGNTTAGALAGMQQQYLANQGQGVNAVGSAESLAQSGPQAALAAEAQRRGIPVQALGMLATLGIPIAGLGGTTTSTGTGTSTGTQQMSGAQQFGLISSGIGNMLGGVRGMFAPTGK